LSEDNYLLLPAWTNHISEQNLENMQIRAKESLAMAQTENCWRKGKARASGVELPETDIKGIHCMIGVCGPPHSCAYGTKLGSFEAWLDRIQLFNNCCGKELKGIRDAADQYVDSKEESRIPRRPNQNAVGSCMSGIRRLRKGYDKENKWEMDRDKAKATTGRRKSPENNVHDRPGVPKRRKLV